MLTKELLRADDTLAYQAGAFFGQLALFIIGGGLLASGLRDRREDGKGDGIAKIGIGSALLSMLLVAVLTGL